MHVLKFCGMKSSEKLKAACLSYMGITCGQTRSAGMFSAENLAEDVQVGDIVTIWFNGMIKETYPAQLGVVYRIIKTQ